MYAKIQNGSVEAYPYSFDDLRRDYPNTSFPAVPSSELLAEFGLVHVVVTGQPAHDYTQNVTEGLPTYSAERNRWEQNWILSPASAEEIAQRTDEKAADVRAERNAKLSACDWTQLSDAPVDQTAWAAYRQALRDVSDQAGFPWSVTWPQEP